MDYLRSALIVLAAVLALVSAPARAGYATATAPPGFGGGPGAWLYKAAANESWLANGTVRTNAALSVGGRVATLPASMRLAANAPLFLARAAYMHPLLLAGTVAMPFVLDWALTQGFYLDDDPNNPGMKRWVKPGDPSVCTVGPCYEYKGRDGTWYGDRYQAANSYIGKFGCTGYNSYWKELLSVTVQGVMRFTIAQCLQGAITNPDSSWQMPIREIPPEVPEPVPVSPLEFETELEPVPYPWRVPDELAEEWPVGWPVEAPKINPDAEPWPQPWRIPVGAPIPIPGTDPQEYKQPYIDVRPAPSPSDPWRVDLEPGEQIGTDPNGLPEPNPSQPAPQPKPDEPQPDVCETNPNAAMCKPLGSGDDGPPIPTRVVPLVITPVSGFGPSTAECPAPRSVTLAGGFALAMPFDLFCQFADGIRPVIVGLAWLSAVLAFLGLSRKE